MEAKNKFDVIIIGGSFAGLSAAMALGRALRRVLIIDSGKPCNRQTPHSHNFITHDGSKPLEILAAAKKQVAQYATVEFFSGIASTGKKIGTDFEIITETGEVFLARKLIFATGIIDIMPAIPGFAECWGISILHCPYCHGYEVRNEKTGIIGNGEFGYEFSKLIFNWTKDLTLFTNGKSLLTAQQSATLSAHNIPVIEKEIGEILQQDGYMRKILFRDGSEAELKAAYARPAFRQHCDIPQQLDCELTEHGYVKIDAFQKTTIPGVYACGDNATFMRSLANVVAMGTFAGAMLNKEMVDEDF